MKKYLFYLSMALVAVVLFSCKGGKKSVFTPTSSGRAYEILVVVDNPVWERPAGRALYNVLDTDVPGLPFVQNHVYFCEQFRCYPEAGT